MQPGVVHLQILTARRQCCRPRLQLGAEFSSRTSGFGLGLFVGFEGREQRFELADALLVAHDVGGDVVDRLLEIREFGLGLAVFALGLGEPLRGGAEQCVVGVESLHQVGLGRPGCVQSALGGGDGFGGLLELGGGRAGAGESVVEGRSGGAAAGRADAPPPQAEPGTGCGDHDRIGVAQCCIDRVTEIVDTNRRAQQAIEQHVDTGTGRTSVRAHGIADAWPRLTRRPSAECDDGTRRVGSAQCVEGSSTGCGIVDHDRGQRLAECSFDRRLPAGVDLDQVEQRSEDAVDTREPFGSGAGAGGVERQFERLDPGPEPGSLLGRVVTQRLAGLVGRFRLGECGLGQLDLGDEGLLDRPCLVAFGAEPDGALGAGVAPLRKRIESLAESPKVGGRALE